MTMKILLDTHTLLWTLYNSSKLPEEIKDIIESEKNTVFFSLASLWEIQIKHDKHPDAMPFNARVVMSDAIEEIEMINIFPMHIFNLSTLADIHNDPFDRILMMQAKCEDMKLLTADHIIEQYGYPFVLPFRPV